MRILLFPPAMRMGGSQSNAVELGEELSRRGHDVVIFSHDDGPLRGRVEAAGIPFEPAPPRPKVRPWPPTMNRLNEVARRYSVDIVHGYEWPPILEATYGPFLRLNVPVVGTIMSMGVAPFIPHHIPLIVGTAQIAEAERARRTVVELIEPPVDVEGNQPGEAGQKLRENLGMSKDDFLVVVVSRLSSALKREGLLEAVRCVGELSSEMPIHLLVVGDGQVRGELERLSSQVNAESGREAVVMVGEVVDPRPMYDAADVVIGMGGSALRGLAFAKPLVVQGERGFWRLLDESSFDVFLHQGWYGIGDGANGVARLKSVLLDLYRDSSRRAALGTFGRSLVVERFSLERAGAMHELLYARVLAEGSSRSAFIRRGAGPLLRALSHEVSGHVVSIVRGGSAEDFNSIGAQPPPSLKMGADTA